MKNNSEDSKFVSLFLSIFLLIPFSLAGLAIVGCKSPPDRIAYNTIGSIDSTATKSLDGLEDFAIQGKVSLTDLHTASVAYNELHQGLLIAAIASSQGTNALTPSNLLTNSLNFAHLILTIEGKK